MIDFYSSWLSEQKVYYLNSWQIVYSFFVFCYLKAYSLFLPILPGLFPSLSIIFLLSLLWSILYALILFLLLSLFYFLLELWSSLLVCVQYCYILQYTLPPNFSLPSGPSSSHVIFGIIVFHISTTFLTYHILVPNNVE